MINILNQIAEKWFSWQLSMFWQVGLLIIIVAGLDFLIKKWAWPQLRYALWLLILVKVILPPTLTSPMSFTAEIPFMVKHTLNSTEYNNLPALADKLRQDYDSGSDGQIELKNNGYDPVIVSTIQNVKPIETVTAPSIIVINPASAATPLSSKSYVFIIWLAGVGILSGWLVIRLRNLRHSYIINQVSTLPERLENLLISTSQKMGLSKTPQVILTDNICCPAVFGVFRPILLMPAEKLKNMTTQDAEHIFLHELAHIKRGDLIVHTFYMILQIVYWFNPLLWLIRKHLQNLREICCDATVARILKEKTIGYRQTLLETARQLLAQPVEPGLGLLGLFENSSWLVDRLGWLEKKSWRYRPLRIATIFVMICLMSAFVLPMTKTNEPADFVIRGTVTDAQTGKPISGATVGDAENYAEGKFYTTTDIEGNYSYKTYYEEHNLKCQAQGYKIKNNILLTKIFGKEKEKVINFALEPENSSNNVDYASASIEEGVGFDDIIVGNSNCTGEFLKSKLGKPEKEVKDDKTGWWLVYHKKYGLDFWGNLQEDTLGEIRLNKGFKGRLTSGISMVSNKQDVFAAYGKPVSEIQISQSEIVKSRDEINKSFTNQALYNQNNSEISKIYYEQKGLLFWFEGDKINQIVIYRKKLPEEPNTINAYPINFEITGRKFQPGDSIEITEIQGSSDTISTGQTYTIKGKYKLSSADEAMLHIYATNGETESRQGSAVHRGTGDFTRTFKYIENGMLHLSFYPVSGGSSFGSLYFAQKGFGQKTPDISSITDTAPAESSKPDGHKGETHNPITIASNVSGMLKEMQPSITEIRKEAAKLKQLQAQKAPQGEIDACEKRIDELGKKIETIAGKWGEKWEKEGKHIGDDAEKQAENYSEHWQKFGEDMGEWGRQFGRQMQEQYGNSDNTGNNEKNDFEKTETILRQFPEGSLLIVDIPNCKVSIAGQNRNDCSIIAKIKADNREKAEQMKLNLREDNKEFTLSLDNPQNSSASLDIVIALPFKASLQCQIGNGHISCSELEGKVTANVGNGNIEISKLAGDAEINLGNGKIFIKDSKFNQQCEINMGNGLVVLEDIRGKAHYEIDVKNGVAKVAYAKNAGGVGHVEVDVADGKIEFGCPDNMSAKIEADTVDGNITTSLPLKVEKQDNGDGASLEGTIGSGEGHIELDVKDGSIAINANAGE